MRKLLLATVGLGAMGGPQALAADVVPPAPVVVVAPVATGFSWTGLYVGASGGAGLAHTCWVFVGTTAGGPAVPPIDEGCNDATGWVAGGQIGYNAQFGSLVVGVEAQGYWANLSGQNESVGFPGWTNRTRVDRIGLFTGRLGFAADRLLLYGKAGAAVVANRYDYWLTPGDIVGTAQETIWAPAIGAGVDFAVTDNITFGVEYDYVRTASHFVQFASPSGSQNTITQGLHLFTARVNLLFGG